VSPEAAVDCAALQRGRTRRQPGPCASGISAGWRRTGSPCGAQTGERTCPFAAVLASGSQLISHTGSSGRPVGDRRRLRQDRQQKTLICRMFSTGATGLEPATSGVTGRNRMRHGLRTSARKRRRGRTGATRPVPFQGPGSLPSLPLGSELLEMRAAGVRDSPVGRRGSRFRGMWRHGRKLDEPLLP
jgi:hypothetical protein